MQPRKDSLVEHSRRVVVECTLVRETKKKERRKKKEKTEKKRDKSRESKEWVTPCNNRVDFRPCKNVASVVKTLLFCKS